MTQGIPPGARRVVLLAAWLVVPAAVAGWSTGGWDRVWGVLGGAGLTILNFWFLARLVVNTTAGEGVGMVEVLGRLAGKFGLLAGALAVMILILRLDALGVLLGLCLVYVAVVLDQVVGRWNEGA